MIALLCQALARRERRQPPSVTPSPGRQDSNSQVGVLEPGLCLEPCQGVPEQGTEPLKGSVPVSRFTAPRDL